MYIIRLVFGWDFEPIIVILGGPCSSRSISRGVAGFEVIFLLSISPRAIPRCKKPEVLRLPKTAYYQNCLPFVAFFFSPPLYFLYSFSLLDIILQHKISNYLDSR